MPADLQRIQALPSPSLRGSGLKWYQKLKCMLDKWVSLFTREWIEISDLGGKITSWLVSLFTREWIEISGQHTGLSEHRRSPSLRGSGLKSAMPSQCKTFADVSLFTREWIEIKEGSDIIKLGFVSLFTREWIEIWRLIT